MDHRLRELTYSPRDSKKLRISAFVFLVLSVMENLAAEQPYEVVSVIAVLGRFFPCKFASLAYSVCKQCVNFFGSPTLLPQ